MSSESDQTVFQQSVEGQDNTILFSEKKYTYITDNSSNNGVFHGQLGFDLNSLSSQQNWTDLSEAYIQFPVKLSLKSNLALTSSTVSANAATIKSGFHNFVDSIQITLGGSTCVSSQIFTNIDTSYKILTEWSKDEYEKFGPSLGLSLDDYQMAADGAAATDSLDNVAIATLSPAYRGVCNNDIARNPGFKERCNFLNNDMSTSTSAAKTILGTNMSSLGKGQAVFNAGSRTAGQDFFALYAIGTVRLKDISDFCSKVPLIKSMKGYIYVNYNSASSTFINTQSASANNLLTATPVNSSIYGRCQPGCIDSTNTTYLDNTVPSSITFTSEVSSTISGDLTTVAAPLTGARLYCPYYNALPEIDRILSQKKTFRYNERFVTTFDIDASGNYSGTISPGITNAQRIILYPYNTGAGAATPGLLSYAVNPLISPWDSAPNTTSPFSALKNLQITLGGKQVWQSPIDFDYEIFLQEISKNGLDGSQDVETTNSSILDQRKWDQMYRFYTANLARRYGAEDGSSKAIQLSCTNATLKPMSVICIVHYQREITVDTSLGHVTQNL